MFKSPWYFHCDPRPVFKTRLATLTHHFPTAFQTSFWQSSWQCARYSGRPSISEPPCVFSNFLGCKHAILWLKPGMSLFNIEKSWFNSPCFCWGNKKIAEGPCLAHLQAPAVRQLRLRSRGLSLESLKARCNLEPPSIAISQKVKGWKPAQQEFHRRGICMDIIWYNIWAYTHI